VTSYLDHDELNGQAVGYVLGTLAPAEYAEFRAHLSECALCASTVCSLLPVIGALAYAAPSADPSEALRARVLERVRSVDVGPRVPEAQPPRSLVLMSPPDVARDEPEPVEGSKDESRAGSGAARPRATLLPGRWLPVAAALVIAAGLGVDAVRLRERIGSLELRLRDISERADASERELTSVRQSAAEAQTLVVVLASSDLIRVDLAGQPSAPMATARAFWSRSRGLIFTASSLPPLPAGRTYQLWIVTPDAPVSAGLLKPGERGDVHAVFTAPRDVARVAAVAVTIEPEGGVPAPTGEKYLVGLAN
jgi:anti-sigma-K factor RskA/putative zinc finger protein